MSKRILFVDDSETIRELVKFTLEEAGYTVVVAADALVGKDIISEKHFDLLLTDLHMPNMDGVELIREVRKIPDCKFMPILFLTTETRLDRKKEGKDAGATGWITKPFDSEKLLRVIRKVLR